MSACHLCGSERLTEIVNLGMVPLAHRLTKERDENEYRRPLALHICEGCALIQIIDPVPPEVLYQSGYNFCFTAWKQQPQTAREIELIRQCVYADQLVVEIGSNDGGFLREMRAAGLNNVVGVEPNKEARCAAARLGVASYEGLFDISIVARIRAESGQASMIVARQVVEHIERLPMLMKNIRHLLKPGGWLMIEVPDFEVPLRHGDLTAIWEEHVNYFTEPSLTALFAEHGFRVDVIERYPTNAGAIMMLAQKVDYSVRHHRWVGDIRTLAAEYLGKAKRYGVYLSKVLENSDFAVLYGAGCRANIVMNGMGMFPLLDAIVDDQPEKQGLWMAGGTHQIQSSDAMRGKSGLCVLCVNAENEEAVMARYPEGWTFLSACSPSPLYNKVLEGA